MLDLSSSFYTYFTRTHLKGSSTSFSFTNVAPDDTFPYIMRVVVMPDTAGSMKTTVRRQIWIPGKKLRMQSKNCGLLGRYHIYLLQVNTLV